MAYATGTIIKNSVEFFGIRTHEGCGCTELANEMNQYHPELILGNPEPWVLKMQESIKKWKGRWPIPSPPDSVVRSLITFAAKKNLDQLNGTS